VGCMRLLQDKREVEYKAKGGAVQTSSPSKDEEWWRAPKRVEASMRV